MMRIKISMRVDNHRHERNSFRTHRTDICPAPAQPDKIGIKEAEKGSPWGDPPERGRIGNAESARAESALIGLNCRKVFLTGPVFCRVGDAAAETVFLIHEHDRANRSLWFQAELLENAKSLY